MSFSENQTKRASLPEVHRSIAVPETGSFWRKMLAYAGPGYLVSVGYMDPGNWATDLAGMTAAYSGALHCWRGNNKDRLPNYLPA